MFSWVENNELHYLKIDEFLELGINAYFTSRIGGVSNGSYSSLNLGLHTADSKENILKNRELIASSIGVTPESFVSAEQIHGDKVYIVNKEDIGLGAYNYKDSIVGVDAIITGERGIPLLSLYADCVPLFFADPVKRIVALAHAGWKGTVKKNARKTIMMMREHFAVQTSNIIAAVGPSISKDFYEVDELVINKLKFSFDNFEEFTINKGKGHYLLDLWEANISVLREVGLKEENIILSNLCTYSNNDFFYSYRKEQGNTGRMASIIFT